MDKSKLLEYFDATTINKQINVVGCGAIGSHICEMLARLGFESVDIYDFDTVDAHNITNQRFVQSSIGMPKVNACEQCMKEINPDMTVTVHAEGLQEPYVLPGVIILAVDDIELRQKIVQANKYNPLCSMFLDFRMRLTDAQHYLAMRNNTQDMEKLTRSMNFTHEEAKDATPTSACGVQLSVVYTVINIVSLGMANMIAALTNQPYKTMIVNDMKSMSLLTF